jgi:hypothetical protein
MSTSFTFETPMASFSAINNNLDDDSQNSFYTTAATIAKRDRGISPINLAQARTTDNRNIQDNDDEADQSLTEHYEFNRKKQEKLLLFSNIFRLLVVCVLAPLIYFLV